MSERRNCPLCKHQGTDFFTDQKCATPYYRCEQCDLIWMHPDSRVSSEDELAHYNTHNNDPADPRYRAFLSKLWDPLKERLPATAKGLDYGSGPGPTLHLMAEEDGFECAHYDPYFHRDDSALQNQYDFITCSETAEHFYDPDLEFNQLADRLLPGGWLGVMTTRYDDQINFKNWHYRHDPTHVAFYTDKTFEAIADRFNFEQPVIVSKSVVLLRKSLD